MLIAKLALLAILDQMWARRAVRVVRATVVHETRKFGCKVNRMFYHRFWDEWISKDPNYHYYAVSLNANGKWTQQDKANNKNWICEKYTRF
uniref:C-type lectin domain-containing protein n=1 Tax=Oryzias latipes TaxID=8090 RepID=A0A3P9JSR2_ORYLA